MKSSYVIRARQFAHDIYPFICDCKTVEDYCTAVENFNVAYHRSVRVACGQTRVALITSDYVLKLDYGRKAKRFGGCVSEYRAYQKVFNDGYAYLFAKINPVMVNEKVFYIMPRINGIGYERNGDDDAFDVVTNEEQDYLWDNFRDLHYENYGWKNNRPVIVDYAYCTSNGSWR